MTAPATFTDPRARYAAERAAYLARTADRTAQLYAAARATLDRIAPMTLAQRKSAGGNAAASRLGIVPRPEPEPLPELPPGVRRCVEWVGTTQCLRAATKGRRCRRCASARSPKPRGTRRVLAR